MSPTSEEKSAANPTGSYNYIIGIVSELTKLEHLDLCDWYFNSLSGLENLTQLKTLIINYNYVRDLTPLLSCTQLEELHVARNRMCWNNEDIGVGNLLNDDGSLKLPA